MLAGTIIKILKDTKAISPKDAFISKYEVVTVIDETDTGILVKNILDDYMLIPIETLYKIIKQKNIKVPNLKQIYKSLKQAKLLSDVEITADEYDPFGPQPFSQFGIKIKRKPKDTAKANPLLIRIVQKAQIICSNALNTENVLESNKLVLAAICADMAGIQGLNNNQINRLIQLSNKLIAASSNK